MGVLIGYVIERPQDRTSQKDAVGNYRIKQGLLPFIKPCKQAPQSDKANVAYIIAVRQSMSSRKKERGDENCPRWSILLSERRVENASKDYFLNNGNDYQELENIFGPEKEGAVKMGINKCF
jgi:hypothetical protein